MKNPVSQLCKLVAGLGAVLAMSLPLHHAAAGPAGAEGDDFIYRVEPGDILLTLAQRYTGNAANWTRLQALNGVQDPRRLSIGRELRIPFELIPQLPAHARVVHVTGQANVNDVPLTLGAQVGEGDVVSTDMRGFVTLVLADGSTLSVPAGSLLHVERMRVFQGTQLTDSIVRVRRGALESQVAPADTGVGRFEVLTPVTITGVRGTQLRVRANEEGAQSEVMAGRARVRASDQGNVMVGAGHGATTDASGTLQGVRPLLAAPALDVPVRRGGSWQADFAPVPGAAAYLVQVADDLAGTQLYSRQRISGPPATFIAPGAGTYHVLVRAIDSDGIMGEDAAQPFLGRIALMSGSGKPVLTGFADPIILTDY